MAPLFPGCDYEHWLIVMDKPGGEGATKQQMIDCYVQTLAKVLGRSLFIFWRYIFDWIAKGLLARILVMILRPSEMVCISVCDKFFHGSRAVCEWGNCSKTSRKAKEGGACASESSGQAQIQ
uniref:MORF/ORRM1/DAG-like MORF domain-containing protein n=1 Tax=Arundo donax TaxID=35708 RepID=A0A0A8ZV37_ARUDO